MPRHKLSEAFLKGSRATPTKGQIDYWDTLTPGFGVRIGHGGRKAFQVLTRVDGRIRRFTLKPAYPALSLAAARDQAAKILKDAQAGLDPAAAKAEERRKAQARRRNTFGAVAADFMEDFAKNHRTRGEMQRKIDVELLPRWGDRPIASITRADVKELVRIKARDGDVSANRLLALVSRIFSWALDEEIIASSPAVRIGYNEEQERERVLTDDEIRALWPAFSRLGYPFGSVLQMALVCGQRRGEIAGMRWSEIGSNGWSLPSARAKTKVGHLVPLSSLAREILDAVPHNGDDLVFVGRRAGKPLQGWSKAKARADRYCPDVHGWRIHDLRRAMATHMRGLGVDRLVVSKLLNHAEAGMTKVYDRYSADPEKAAAMERWATRLREIIAGKDETVIAFGRSA
jgi:integrase